MEKEEGWRRCGAGFLTDRARGEGTTCQAAGERDKQLFVHRKPSDGKCELEAADGGGRWHPRRSGRQQGSIMIKLTAGRSALVETGLSFRIRMNWKGETAWGATQCRVWILTMGGGRILGGITRLRQTVSALVKIWMVQSFLFKFYYILCGVLCSSQWFFLFVFFFFCVVIVLTSKSSIISAEWNITYL